MAILLILQTQHFSLIEIKSCRDHFLRDLLQLSFLIKHERLQAVQVRDRGNPSGLLYKAPSVIRMKLPVYILR